MIVKKRNERRRKRKSRYWVHPMPQQSVAFLSAIIITVLLTFHIPQCWAGLYIKTILSMQKFIFMSTEHRKAPSE